MIAIGMMLVFTACSGGDSNKKDGSGDDQTVVIGLSSDPMSFNPNASADDDGYNIFQNIYNRLYKVNNNQEVVPDLAYEHEVSEDGLELTFHLHEGVKWHDGEDFTAEDVQFTFETIIEEKGQASGSLTSVDEITAPDDNTVVFHLNKPDSSLLGNIAWYGTFIMPKHIYEGTDWTDNPANQDPVGTGPFTFVEHEKGVNVTIQKNEDYFGDVPKIDRVIYSIIPDANTAIQALSNGELDILGITAPFSEMSKLKENDQYDYGELIWPARFQIALNQEDENFSKLEVRQAVTYGIDKEKVVSTALKGNGQVSKTGMVPAYENVLNTDDVFPDRDVEKGRQLLEDAGYEADGDGVYFSTTLDVMSGEPYEDIAAVIKESLGEIGIDVSINIMEIAAWTDKVWTNKNYEFSLLGGYQGPGPAGLHGRFSSDGSMNIYNYSNEELDQNLIDAFAQVSEEDSAPYYKEAQRIIVEDIPMVPLSEWMMVDPYQDYISGHPMSDEVIDKTGFSELTYITIDK